jgi:hypothetical protein
MSVHLQKGRSPYELRFVLPSKHEDAVEDFEVESWLEICATAGTNTRKSAAASVNKNLPTLCPCYSSHYCNSFAKLVPIMHHDGGANDSIQESDNDSIQESDKQNWTSLSQDKHKHRLTLEGRASI